MSFDLIRAQLAHGWQVIASGGTATLIVLLLCCVLFTAGAALVSLIAMMIVRVRVATARAEQFEVWGNESDKNLIDIAVETASKSAIKELGSGKQIVLVPSGFFATRAHGKLQRRNNLSADKIEVSPYNFKRLTGKVWNGTPQKVGLWIRPGGSILGYPDEGVRVSTVVALWLSAFNLVATILVSAIFWSLPPSHH